MQCIFKATSGGRNNQDEASSATIEVAAPQWRHVRRTSIWAAALAAQTTIAVGRCQTPLAISPQSCPKNSRSFRPDRDAYSASDGTDLAARLRCAAFWVGAAWRRRAASALTGPPARRAVAHGRRALPGCSRCSRRRQSRACLSFACSSPFETHAEAKGKLFDWDARLCRATVICRTAPCIFT